jgi:hypothetical protein
MPPNQPPLLGACLKRGGARPASTEVVDYLDESPFQEDSRILDENSGLAVPSRTPVND